MHTTILERIGVIVVGPYSDGVAGKSILAMERMAADFHCVGTTDVDNEKFMKASRGAAKH